MNPYEMRQEAKRQRLELAAERAEARSTAAHRAARAAVDGIPFGQPILVGHHSEKRHRRALERSDNAMRRACAETDKANEYASRAAAVGTGGISSDDPDAIAKLTDKRSELEIRRDHMKDANKFYKKHGTLAGWDGPAAVAADGLVTLQYQPYYKAPFPTYALALIGARIRTAGKRAEQISARNTEAEPSEEEHGANRVHIDEADNRVGVSFAVRLSKDDYKKVRSNGFVWSPTRNQFVRKFGRYAIDRARHLADTLPTPSTPTSQPEITP